MRVVSAEIPDVLILEPKIFGDPRGFFAETWNRSRYAEAGITADFVQDNISLSARGVLRGMHYQHPHDQAKLVMALTGEVLDVVIDIRVGSPTFGRWTSVTLSGDNLRQLYVPPGFAHGFYVLSETARFVYKVTDTWHPECEGGVRWDDPSIGIAWPTREPTLSEKDKRLPTLAEIDRARLPTYVGSQTR